MTIFAAARMAVRVVGLAMLILGLVTWRGGADWLVPVHVILGIGLVMALWTVALVASQVRARPTLAALTCAWGVLMVVFGMTQAEILPDANLHVAIRASHLVAGIAAVGLAEALGVAATRTRTPAGR